MMMKQNCSETQLEAQSELLGSYKGIINGVFITGQQIH